MIAAAALVSGLLFFFIIASFRYLQLRATSLAEDMTAQLRTTKEGLESSNTELAETNFELEQFIYTAAHDLQAPLRTVSSYAMLLEDKVTGITDDGAEYLDRIVGSTNRMSKLLVDLLTYARIGSDEQPRSVDLQSLVSEVVSDVLGTTETAVSIGELPTVIGHETHLRLLIQNYFDNAVKFSKPDEPLRLQIEAEHTDVDVVISIQDNGIGFDPDFSDRAFAVFQRLPGSEEVDGTGIGLAHCRKIARMHNGRTWATSTPGVGSTFYFSIAHDLGETPKVLEPPILEQVKGLT